LITYTLWGGLTVFGLLEADGAPSGRPRPSTGRVDVCIDRVRIVRIEPVRPDRAVVFRDAPGSVGGTWWHGLVHDPSAHRPIHHDVDQSDRETGTLSMLDALCRELATEPRKQLSVGRAFSRLRVGRWS